MESFNETSQRGGEKIRYVLGGLAIGVALIYFAFLKPGIWGFDGQEMLQTSISLVLKHNFILSPGMGVLGREGQYYPLRYPLLPIVAMPFVAVGLGLSSLLHLPSAYVAGVCALVLSVLLTVGTAVLVALIALRLGSPLKGAFIAALSFAFGTIALVYSREFFSEPLLALLTAGSLYWVVGQSQRELIGASFLAGLAITAKPSAIILGPLLSLYVWVKYRSLKLAVLPCIGTAIGVILFMAYNYMRFGSFTSAGKDIWTLEGVLPRFFGLLFGFGPGGGLLWYCLPVILALVGFQKAVKASKGLEALLLVAVFAGYLFLHSFVDFSGWSWGPRFLFPALPGLFALAAIAVKSIEWRKTLVTLTILGFIVNSPSLISYYQAYYAEATDQNIRQESLVLWASPLKSPLAQSWGAAYRQVENASQNDVREVIRQAGAPPKAGEFASAELLKIVAVWWWMLPIIGIPVWIGFLMAMGMVGVGIWSLYNTWLLVR